MELSVMFLLSYYTDKYAPADLLENSKLLYLFSEVA